MARGGYRPGGGRPKGSTAAKKSGEKRTKECDRAKGIPSDVAVGGVSENLEPLAFMLRVMNDPEADKERRDRMAIAAAPFCHSRPSEGKGKKAGAEEKARAAGSGKFATSAPPNNIKLVK